MTWRDAEKSGRRRGRPLLLNDLLWHAYDNALNMAILLVWTCVISYAIGVGQGIRERGRADYDRWLEGGPGRLRTVSPYYFSNQGGGLDRPGDGPDHDRGGG